MKIIKLNDKQILRLQIVRQLEDCLITNKQAAEKLTLSVRQVIRIKQRYKQLGTAGLMHQGRGKSKAHAISKETKERVIEIFKCKYSNLNFSHFTEK